MFLKVPFRSIQHVSVLPDVPWFHFYEMIWQEYDRSIEPTNSLLNSFSAMAKVFLLPKESAKVKRQDAQLIMRESMEMEMAKVRQEWNCLSLSQQRRLIIEKGVYSINRSLYFDITHFGSTLSPQISSNRTGWFCSFCGAVSRSSKPSSTQLVVALRNTLWLAMQRRHQATIPVWWNRWY